MHVTVASGGQRGELGPPSIRARRRGLRGTGGEEVLHIPCRSRKSAHLPRDAGFVGRNGGTAERRSPLDSFRRIRQQVRGTLPLRPLELEAVHVNSSVPPWEIASEILVTVRVGF